MFIRHLQFFLFIIILCLATSYFRATVFNTRCPKYFSQANIQNPLFITEWCDFVFFLGSYPPSVQSEGGMHAVITHPFALEREMRERYHAQPRTHCFCAHAREKQGGVKNHLQRKTVEQVNKQRHGTQGGWGGHHREEERKHKEAMGSSQEGEIERGKRTTS